MAPMPQLSTHRATYDDIVALPPHVTGQVIDGELYTSPRPAGDHAVFTSALGMEIGTPYMRGRGGPGGWWIIDEPELHFAEDVVVPDLAGWRRERLPDYPTGPWISLSPDWVCETLSPSTAFVDRARKMAVYAREGVPNLWLADPRLRTLEVYALESGRWVLNATHSGDAVVRIAPFDGVELALGTLWPKSADPGELAK